MPPSLVRKCDVASSQSCQFADDGGTIIKERFYSDKTDQDLMHVEMTSIDNVLTRPWTITKNFRRDREVIWNENNCANVLIFQLA